MKGKKIDVTGGGGRLERSIDCLVVTGYLGGSIGLFNQYRTRLNTFSSHHSFIHLQIHIGSHTVCTRGECLKKGSLLPIVYVYFSQSLGGNKTDLGR